MEVRDETYYQFNSYFVWHSGLRDHGLFPGDPDGDAAATARPTRLGGCSCDGASRSHPDAGRADAKRADADPCDSDAGPRDQHARPTHEYGDSHGRFLL